METDGDAGEGTGGDNAAGSAAAALAPVTTGKASQTGRVTRSQTDVELSPAVQRLIQKLGNHDPGLTILKLSEEVGKLSKTIELHAILDALLKNTSVRVLYMQDQPANDRTIDLLIRVLKQKRIFAANLGELDTGIGIGCVSTWQPLIDALSDTNLCFAYVSEPQKGCLSPQQKGTFKAKMKQNSIDYKDWLTVHRSVAAQVELMWYNPKNSPRWDSAAAANSERESSIQQHMANMEKVLLDVHSNPDKYRDCKQKRSVKTMQVSEQFLIGKTIGRTAKPKSGSEQYYKQHNMADRQHEMVYVRTQTIWPSKKIRAFSSQVCKWCDRTQTSRYCRPM